MKKKEKSELESKFGTFEQISLSEQKVIKAGAGSQMNDDGDPEPHIEFECWEYVQGWVYAYSHRLCGGDDAGGGNCTSCTNGNNGYITDDNPEEWL